MFILLNKSFHFNNSLREVSKVVELLDHFDKFICCFVHNRYIVQYAAEVGGVVVTTDNYRDLLEENPTWKETIQKR